MAFCWQGGLHLPLDSLRCYTTSGDTIGINHHRLDTPNIYIATTRDAPTHSCQLPNTDSPCWSLPQKAPHHRCTTGDTDPAKPKEHDTGERQIDAS
jgi:hypothetical protein